METQDNGCTAPVIKARPADNNQTRIVLNNANRDRFLDSLDAEEEPNEVLVRVALDFNRRYEKSGCD